MMNDAYIKALEWYVDAGIDVAVTTEPYNRLDHDTALPQFAGVNESAPTTPAPVSKADNQSIANIIKKATDCATAAHTLDTLRDAINQFDHHPLKATATQLVFGDGVTDNVKIMVIGDPPSNAEDREGRAFCGPDGHLLDKILGSIGHDRHTNSYVTHITHWRPPGNRTPTHDALAYSKPFIEQQITLINPDYLLVMGQTACQTLFATEKTLSRIRGQWFEYGARKIPSLVTFAPQFLMNNPVQKRKVWQDILTLQDAINA